MAYATVEDVQDKAPQLPAFTPSTKPSYTQVQGFVDDCERVVNASLANLGYVVPVTGTESVAILKDLVAHAALAKALRARGYGTNNPGDLAGAAAAQAYYDGKMKALGSDADPFELPDAPRGADVVEKHRAEISFRGESATADASRIDRDMAF